MRGQRPSGRGQADDAAPLARQRLDVGIGLEGQDDRRALRRTVVDEPRPSANVLMHQVRRSGRKLVVSISSEPSVGLSADRPGFCLLCGLPAWLNGKREVHPVHRNEKGEADENLKAVRTKVMRVRARCPSRKCPDWTIYEEGGYPHRQFQPDVVADAVAEIDLGSQTMTAVATEHGCSRDSVRRWNSWVGALAKPQDLQQLCARIDPDAVVYEPRFQSPAAIVLGHLERLVELLDRAGVTLPRAAFGLTRLLRSQFDRFRDIFYLTRQSPLLRADPAGVGL